LFAVLLRRLLQRSVAKPQDLARSPQDLAPKVARLGRDSENFAVELQGEECVVRYRVPCRRIGRTLVARTAGICGARGRTPWGRA